MYINSGVIAYFNRMNTEIIVCGSNDYNNWDWSYEMCENYPDYDDEITNNMIDHFTRNPEKNEIAKFIMRNSYQYFCGENQDEILRIENDYNIRREYNRINGIMNEDDDDDFDTNEYYIVRSINKIIFTEENNVNDNCMCNDNNDLEDLEDECPDDDEDIDKMN
jgi:hypothetical protein